MISPGGGRLLGTVRSGKRRKDSAQEANEGWGVNLHISAASAGQRQQPDQWSSEQDPQGSPPKPEQSLVDRRMAAGCFYSRAHRREAKARS